MNTLAYPEQLQSDFLAQGLGKTSRTNLADNPGWSGMFDVLALTRRAGSPLHRNTTAGQPEMQTGLGQVLLDYGNLEDAMPFSPIGSYACDSGAEATLISRISDIVIRNPNTFAPVTIVEDDEPLAVIAGTHEFYSYGLRTDLSKGIIGGFFSQAPDEILKRMRNAETAFHIDAKEVGVSTPLRASGLLLPPSVIEELAEVQRPFEVSLPYHPEVAAQAAKLLETSQPLPPADAVSTENWRRAANHQYELPY